MFTDHKLTKHKKKLDIGTYAIGFYSYRNTATSMFRTWNHHKALHGENVHLARGIIFCECNASRCNNCTDSANTNALDSRRMQYKSHTCTYAYVFCFVRSSNRIVMIHFDHIVVTLYRHNPRRMFIWNRYTQCNAPHNRLRNQSIPRHGLQVYECAIFPYESVQTYLASIGRLSISVLARSAFFSQQNNDSWMDATVRRSLRGGRCSA